MKPRVIAIVSPVGGSGKTTVTVNLAAALGEMGRSSLIIDLDLMQDGTGMCGFGLNQIEPPTIRPEQHPGASRFKQMEIRMRSGKGSCGYQLWPYLSQTTRSTAEGLRHRRVPIGA